MGQGFFVLYYFSALTSIDYRCILYIDNLCIITAEKSPEFSARNTEKTKRKEEENLHHGQKNDVDRDFDAAAEAAF